MIVLLKVPGDPRYWYSSETIVALDIDPHALPMLHGVHRVETLTVFDAATAERVAVENSLVNQTAVIADAVGVIEVHPALRHPECAAAFGPRFAFIPMAEACRRTKEQAAEDRQAYLEFRDRPAGVTPAEHLEACGEATPAPPTPEGGAP